MTVRQIQQRLKNSKSFLARTFKVKSIGVFGSYALGQETEASDIDLLVEFYEPVGWEFIDLKEYLENALEKQVDLVTVKALKPQMKKTILEQVIYV